MFGHYETAVLAFKGALDKGVPEISNDLSFAEKLGRGPFIYYGAVIFWVITIPYPTMGFHDDWLPLKLRHQSFLSS